jgi:glycosyltransferase involved in cell wall biosynthesis
MNEPLVSVLMTAYNREKYIAEAMESVMASTYSNWELIVVDDRSRDNTVAIAREFEKKDSRIKVYVNERNLGDYPNRNKAASYARGKYLKFLDSDDMINADGLEYCVREMEKYPNAAIGMVTYKKVAGNKSFAVSSAEVIRNHFFKQASLGIGPTGSIITREYFERNNGFDTRFKVASDNYFNIRLAMLGDVVFLPYRFFYYREHEGQEIHNSVGYLTHNFLYNKELYENNKLPVTDAELEFLKRKLHKRHSVNLTRYLLKTGNLKQVISVMRDTNYSLPKFLRGFFY